MPRKDQSLDLTGTAYCAAFNTRRAARAITSYYDSAMGPSGLRSTAFAILVGVAKLEPATIGRLGSVLGLDSTTLSRSLRLLEQRGFVAVSARATMRRRFVTLAPRGKAALKRALPFWREAQRRFELEIGSASWKRIQRQMEKIPAYTARLAKSPR